MLGWKSLNKYSAHDKIALTYQSEFERQSTTIEAYQECDGRLYVPRFYGSQPWRSVEGMPIEATFNGTPRDSQLPIIGAYLENSVSGNGIIVAPCGFGKTFITVYIAVEKLKKKTAILVNADGLATQWQSEVSRFSSASSTIYQGNKRSIDADIVIFMAQTLHSSPLSEDEASEFGFLVVDECDTFAANTFNKVIGMFPSHYRLGLTATDRRGDGNEEVFKLHLGPIIYREDIWKLKPTILRVDTEIKLNAHPSTPRALLINKQAKSQPRNVLISQIATSLVKNGRKVLILSDRKAHLSFLQKLIPHKSFMLTENESVGNMPSDVDIVFATWQKCSRGMSIDFLSCVIFATCRQSTEQAAGRIVRKDHGFPAFVVDLVDFDQYYKREWDKRLSRYIDREWDVFLYDIKSKKRERIN